MRSTASVVVILGLITGHHALCAVSSARHPQPPGKPVVVFTFSRRVI